MRYTEEGYKAMDNYGTYQMDISPVMFQCIEDNTEFTWEYGKTSDKDEKDGPFYVGHEEWEQHRFGHVLKDHERLNIHSFFIEYIDKEGNDLSVSGDAYRNATECRENMHEVLWNMIENEMRVQGKWNEEWNNEPVNSPTC